MSDFPRWKYALVAAVLLFGFLYALPNVFPPQPAAQISADRGATIDSALQDKVEQTLKKAKIPYVGISISDQSQASGHRRMLVRFADRPLHYFGLLSATTFGMSLGMMFLAFVDTSAVRLVTYSTVVMPAVALLGFCLSFYFLMMGLICELAQRTSPRTERALAPLARIESLA